MSIDWSTLEWIRLNMQCRVLDFIVPKITALGNGGIIWIISAIVLICTRRYRKQGVMLAIGLLAGFVIGNIALKNIVARPRPCWLDTSVKLLIDRPSDYSFPSGHTLSSAVSAVILSKTDRRFGYAAAPLALLIACSRLYLYVHFPSDILGGALIGVAIGTVVWSVGNKVQERYRQK